MDFKTSLKKIESSDLFKDFIVKYPSSELISGFFIMDFTGLNNQQNIDYRLGEKIFTFFINENNEVVLKEDVLIKNPSLPELKKLNSSLNLDLEELKPLVEITALNNAVNQKFQKIIAVLQNHGKNNEWHLTCMLDAFVILDIRIDSITKEILKFEKRNLMEFMKKG
ncbi:MAG: hypothetical protein ACP5OG_03985 [Candidatus Nanoarchaeia archaeon]